MEIADFIESRLSDWEREATRALEVAESQGGELWVVTGMDNPIGIDYRPLRELAKVAAMRELFERAMPSSECRGHPGPWMRCGDYGPGYCRTPDEADDLRVIASIWSSHPDYLEEWRP